MSLTKQSMTSISGVAPGGNPLASTAVSSVEFVNLHSSGNKRTTAQLICEQFSKSHIAKKKQANLMAASVNDQTNSKQKRNSRKKNASKYHGTNGAQDNSTDVSQEILSNLTFKEREQLAEIQK